MALGAMAGTNGVALGGASAPVKGVPASQREATREVAKDEFTASSRASELLARPTDYRPMYMVGMVLTALGALKSFEIRNPIVKVGLVLGNTIGFLYNTFALDRHIDELNAAKSGR